MATTRSAGPASEFRAELRRRHERYVLDVPSNTLVREVARRRDGKRPAFEPVEQGAARQPPWRWKAVTVRGGEKGPLKVRALRRRVQTKEEGGRVGPSEALVVIRTLGHEPVWWYTLSNAKRRARLASLVLAHGERHRVGQSLQEGKGEVGLGQYEVRSWVGWHHHRALALLALWFVTLQRRRLGKKIPAITPPQVRAIFTELLRQPPPTPRQIARQVNRVSRRNETSRIYAWHHRTGKLPPRRKRPNSGSGPPKGNRLQ